MTAPTLATDADRYLGDVRAALADLEPGDRDDLLEDLQGHLEELRAEDPAVDLVARLGDAASYADELRLSAGLPARDSRSHVTLGERLGRARSALVHLVGSWPGGRAALDLLVQLRPAWWVLRVYGVVAIVGRLWRGGTWRSEGLVPTIHGFRAAGALALAGLVVVSVRVGRSVVMSTGPRRMVLGLANTVLALAAAAYLAGVSLGQLASPSPWPAYPCCGTVLGPNGSPVSNIYAFDENGRAIPRVQLFDQDGQPLDITVNDPTGTAPWHNVFPQRQVLDTVSNPDGSVQEVPRPAPVIAAPRLPASPTGVRPSPTPSPSP